jgi:hypothetical protein
VYRARPAVTVTAVSRRIRPAVALVAWTLFVWATRFLNIWRDDTLDTAGKLGRSALAATFVVLAVAVIATRFRQRGAVLALAGWTTAVWVVRTIGILAHDHDVAFKAVHVVLAVISIALSAWAARSLRTTPAPAPASR